MITTGAISISQALMVNQTLLWLGMRGNQIGDDGIVAIAGSLNNSTVTELNLCDCGIGVVGVRSLAEAISSNQNIRNLMLSDNPITVHGARLIMKAAVDNSVLIYVGIDREYDDDYEVKRLESIRFDKFLQSLHVRSYFHNVANNYCYAYGNRQVIKTPVKMMIVLKRSH